ncbi:hypothetical protein KPL70_023114 [Citrus sinensis]|nr:hypothetical protein KPL70_023114 [Citrus sinensis]
MDSLNGFLEEEVYIEQPLGYVVKGHEDKVLRLKKALYGLNQAPRAWNSIIDKYFQENGFTKCPYEHALYVKEKDGDILIVCLYVDDLIFTGSNPSLFEEFKRVMIKEFEMTDIGLMANYLGIEVKQKEEDIFISQESYAKEILKKFKMNDCKPISMPVEYGVKLSKHDEGEDIDSTFFKSLVGSLCYLTCTRPDILYVVGLLVGYSDSDWGGDVDDRKSITGFVFFMGDTTFTWMSNKQPIVTLSTCEAEYVAATSSVCHAIWLRNLLKELGLPQEESTEICVDNKLAIALSKNPVFHDRSKHIDTRYHFIRECIARKEVQIKYVKSQDQAADIFTKPLKQEDFVWLVRFELFVLGVVSVVGEVDFPGLSLHPDCIQKSNSFGLTFMYLEVIYWSFQLIDCNFASTFVKGEDVKAREIEGYTVRALPTRQWGYVVLTTPDGVLDHEEALRRTVGGQVLGYFH